MKRAGWSAALLLSMASIAAAQTFDVSGFVTARSQYAAGLSSWMRGGLGRFDAGGKDDDRSGRVAPAGDVQLRVDVHPLRHITLHAHGLARAEPSRYRGRRAGLVSAFVEADLDRGRNDFLLRAGQFFTGTSRENVADLWSSPYTISFSALNSWIANEVRPIGLNAEWRVLTSAAVISTSATAFKGNDSMGALLAWRGWTIGNRLSVYKEVLPLPPLQSLRTRFSKQRSDGTVPFETDLDSRVGYAGRIRFTIPERFTLQVTRLDNRGDRLLHRDEYAWATDFSHLAADFRIGETTLLTEWMGGRSTMGPPLLGVDIDYDSAYALASYRAGRSRISIRAEWFRTSDNRPVATDRNDESGRAWTVAWLFDVHPHWRTGAEFTQVTGTHAQAVEAGVSPAIDGRNVIAELRYSIK